VQGETMILSCTHYTDKFLNNIPSKMITAKCQNVFCDNVCGLTISDYTKNETVLGSESNGTRILTTYVEGIAPADYFNSGRLICNNEIRYIRKGDTVLYKGVIQNRIDVNFPIVVYPGKSIKLIAGCDKLLATCKAKYDNQENFIGFPYVPTTKTIDVLTGEQILDDNSGKN
jgi:uncharacterized phage protein (TIGR02218 family)